VLRVDPDGVLRAAAHLPGWDLSAIAAQTDGGLLIAATTAAYRYRSRLERLAPDGHVAAVTDLRFTPRGLVALPDGTALTIDANAARVVGIAADGAVTAVVPERAFRDFAGREPARADADNGDETPIAGLAVGSGGMFSSTGDNLVDHHGWRSVLWFRFALQLVGGLLVLAVVPESPIRNRVRIDWLGATLIGAGVGILLLGLSMGATWHWGDTRTLACMLAGIALLGAWVAAESRVKEPLMDLSLLRSRSITTIVITSMFAGAALAGAATLLPMMVQTPHGLGGNYGFGLTAEQVVRFTVPPACSPSSSASRSARSSAASARACR
jgi:MFS family permease